MPVKVGTRSLAMLRAQARAPRIAVTACAVVLSAVGAASLLASPDRVPARPPAVGPRIDFAAQFAAELAARKLVAGTVSRVIGDEARGPRGRLITVAVTAPDPVDVAVLVSRDAQGRILVHEPLAIVGGAPTRRTPVLEGAREVTDATLVRVVRRVIGNYLRGERDDVAADMASGARVSFPETRIRPRPVDAVTWLLPGRRVAAALSARLASGELVELRYELGVVRSGGRWLISEVHVDPLHQEVRP